MARIRLRSVLAAGVLLGMTACTSAPGPSATSPGSPTSAPRPSATAPPIAPAAEFCGRNFPQRATQRPLPAPDGVTLNTVWLGSGSTTAVLLHQTDGNGMCGFAFYAEFLAKRGVRVALVDLCNYGQSSCGSAPLVDDPAGQVRTVTDAARAAGARRVVLVGASMGGSYAVTAARAARADAIVDLSGPAVFRGVCDITVDAPKVTMPVLFAFTDTDPQDRAAVRQALPAMPSKQKTFRTLDSGHGYELLRDPSSRKFTPLARQVATFVVDGTAS